MGGELIERVKAKVHPVPAVFSHLGIERVTSKDSFTLSYQDGMLEAHVKRESGKTEHVIKYVKGSGFTQVTTFDPDQMSKEERDAIIKTRYAKGDSQAVLAKKFGLTQARISGIVNS